MIPITFLQCGWYVVQYEDRSMHTFGKENRWVVVDRLACCDCIREETHDDAFEKLDAIAELGRLRHEIRTSSEMRYGPGRQTIIAEHFLSKVVVRRLIEEHFWVIIAFETQVQL